jgi:acetyl-CoA carboxylase biotin carboxyl carrier protein
VELSLEEIGELLAYIDRLDAAEVEITLGDVHLLVRRAGAAAPLANNATITDIGGVQRTADVQKTVPADSAREPTAHAASVPASSAPTGAAAALDAWLDAEKAGEAQIIRSPMVGTFYRSKDPGAPPFVEIGSEVTPDDVVCLVEVMKLFHSVPARTAGVVRALFVADNEVVEHMQPLMAVTPA